MIFIIYNWKQDIFTSGCDFTNFTWKGPHPPMKSKTSSKSFITVSSSSQSFSSRFSSNWLSILSGPNQNSGNHYHITSRAHFQFGHVLTCNLTLLSCNMRPGGQLGFQASALSASQAFLSQLDTCLWLSQAKFWTQNAGIFFFHCLPFSQIWIKQVQLPNFCSFDVKKNPSIYELSKTAS